MFKVLNPHLNARKHPRNAHNYESSQTHSSKNKILKIVHIDEDIPEASSPAHSPIPVKLVFAEFLSFPQVCTRNQKVKFVKSTVHPIIQTMVIIQTGHPDNVAKVVKPVIDSPLFTLASVSAELLKDVACKIVPTPA